MKKKVVQLSMFKKMREGFQKRAAEMHKQGMAQTRADELLNELCERLRQMGVNGTVHLSESTAETMGGMLVGGVAGYISIQGRNIDAVQLETVSRGPGSEDSTQVPYMLYYYHYVVMANVEGKEKRLDAELKPIKKGFLSSEVLDFRWEGGELAERLNGNTELRTMLLQQGLSQLPDIEVRAHAKPRHLPGIGRPPQAFPDAQASFRQCVRITKRPRIPSNSEYHRMFEVAGIPIWERRVGAELPTRENFELCDRIASHIHGITDS